MERDSERIRSFTRRAVMVGMLQGGLMGMLGLRLAWLQIAQGQKYRMLAENNRISIKLLQPTRGLILDRNGRRIAVNDQNFRVILIPEQTDNIMAALNTLKNYIELDDRDIQRVLKQAKKQASFMQVEIRENLNWDEVSAVEVHLPELPGISIDEGEIRTYPLGEATAHITGYVGAVSEQTDDPLLKQPGFRIGKAGIEKTFDLPLRGKAGTAEIEVNVVGREVQELNRYNSTPGKTVWLTIDAELQTYAQQRLSQEQSASAIIMDAKTGAVYALGSWPAYDPNAFSRGLPANEWEAMRNDPRHPLNNKAIGGLYPPGSTYKIATALALLEAKKINRSSTAFCPGHFELGTTRFHCWKKQGHGAMNVVSALEQSCDTFFYKHAIELGIDTLAAYSRQLGFGGKLGFEMSEESPGIMPTQAWRKAKFGESWQPGETIVASIGQGYTIATPLQLAVMTARVVNGGYAVRPWITAGIEGEPEIVRNWPSLGFKKENLAIVMQGLEAVVNSRQGTARASRIEDPLFAMGGKTGTAQVRKITREQRASGITEDKLPWHLRHHALFVGYAPLSDPRYVCSVVVEHGGGGSAVAAPVARDLLLAAQKRNPAAPIVRG